MARAEGGMVSARRRRHPYRFLLEPRRERGTGALLAGSAAFMAAVIGVWGLASLIETALPTPVATAKALVDSWTDTEFLSNIGATAERVLLGLIIGSVIGIAIGVAFGLIKPLRLLLQPLVLALYSVPKILFYPLVIPLLSLGTPSKVFMGAIHCAVPCIIIVAGAVLSMPRVYFKLGRSLNMGAWQFFWKVGVWAMIRPVVVSVRVGLGLCVLGVIYAEFFASVNGLGQVLSNAYALGRANYVFAYAISLMALTFLASFGLWRVERALD